MFHFIAMDWAKAYEHLNCVYMSVNSDKEGFEAHFIHFLQKNEDGS